MDYVIDHVAQTHARSDTGFRYWLSSIDRCILQRFIAVSHITDAQVRCTSLEAYLQANLVTQNCLTVYGECDAWGQMFTQLKAHTHTLLELDLRENFQEKDL